MIKRKITNRFIKNTSWLIFEHIFRMALSLVVTGLMARYLGTRNYGLISYGMAYISIFTVICKLGIDSILVNEIIRDRKNTGEIIGTTIFLRLASSILSIFTIYFIVKYLNPDNKTLQMITLIQSISLLFVSFDTVTFWFQSNLQSKYAVVAKSIAFLIVSSWRLILIFIGASVDFFATATIIEAVIIGIFILIFYFRYEGQKFQISLKRAKHLLEKGYHFIIAGLLITVYTQIDKIMLGQLANESVVGIYTAAMTVSGFWMFIPNAIIESARPMIMAAKYDNEEHYKRRYSQLYSTVIWMGVLASIVITIMSKWIILIIFGSGYLGSSNVLNGLIWSRIFSLIGVTRSIWLISENKIKYQKYFVGTGAILNVMLNLTLIPRYGAVGAAIATVVAEVFSSTVALAFFRETRPLLKIIVDAFFLKGFLTSNK